MAGAMRKMGVYLGLVEDQADEYGYDEYSEEYAAEQPAARRRPEYAAVAAPAAAAGYSEVEASRSLTPRQNSSIEFGRITTLHPRTYNEARTIGESFRSGTPVIMNLTDMDDNDAKRLVDFAAGLTFGLHGRIERVTNKVFLLSPQNITVTAEEKARMVEGGFFNQS